MTEQKKNSEQPDFLSWFVTKHVEILFRVSMYTLLPLLILGSAGYALDKYFQKSPLIFITSIVISFILTQIIIYKTFTSVTSTKK